MKKLGSMLILTTVYLLLLGWLVDFRLSIFFDVRELFVLAAGTAVLSFAEWLEGKRRGMAGIRANLLTTGMLSTFVMLLSVISPDAGAAGVIDRLPEAGRPLALSLLIGRLLARESAASASSTGRSMDDRLQEEGSDPSIDSPEEGSAESSPSESTAVTTDRSPDVFSRFRSRLLSAGLSLREIEICEIAAQGRTNADIASGLHVAESTVKKHLQNAFRKLGLARREDLMRLYHAPP